MVKRMKKFLSFAISVVVLAVIVSNKTEILQAVDNVFGSDTVVRWEEMSAEKSGLGSEYKNYFSTLTESQKKAYNHILSEIYSAESEFPASIQVPGDLTNSQLTEVIQAVNYDNPSVMCFGRENMILTSGELCFLEPDYTITPAEQKAMTASLDAVCEKILGDIPADADDFEKELFIHDYIVNNCSYDAQVAVSSSTPYSCLVEGLSACEGYSKAAKYLLEKAGIECYTISGNVKNSDGKTEGHMWNIVNIDGSYYHLDVTWDDPTNQDGKQSLSHLFMNLTDEEISVEHSDYKYFFDCNSTKANYFEKTGTLFSDLDNKSIARLKRLMAKSDGSHLEIRFINQSSYSKAYSKLIKNGYIYKLSSSANKTYGSKLSTSSVGYIENKEHNCIDFYFN